MLILGSRSRLFLFFFFSLVFLSFGLSSQALGFFNAQLHFGQRSTTFKIDGGNGEVLAGSETRLSAHWGPFKSAPVSFGLAYASLKWTDDFPIHGTEIDLETGVWWPLKSNFIPYAKFGYTVAGSYAFQSQPLPDGDPQFVYKPSGLRPAAGLRWQLASKFAAYFEVEKGMRKLKFESIKSQGNAALTTPPDMTLDSLSLLLGFGFNT